MTPRQDIIQRVSIKLWNHNYNAWRLAEGDPTPEFKAKQAQYKKLRSDINYTIKPITKNDLYSVLFKNSVEGMMLDSIRNNTHLKVYVDGISDRSYHRLLHKIFNEAQKKVEDSIWLYTRQKRKETHLTEANV